MPLRTIRHDSITTRGYDGRENGFLVPVFNIHEGFFAADRLPQQVYVTAIYPKQSKGPHLHFIRTGAFTCVSGNVEIVAKVDGVYEVHRSGEDFGYLTVEIPTGVPALLRNTDEQRVALVLNMPYPAWTPDMRDEHMADFSDYFANLERA